VAVTLSFGVDHYKLVNGNDESDEAEYGDPVVLESGGATFFALVEETDDGERVSLFDPDWVFKGRMVRAGFDEYDEVAEELDAEEEEEEPGDGIDEPTASADADEEGDGDGEETDADED
jgi:hypothetical protein